MAWPDSGNLPEWATTPTDFAEPSLGKKQEGWLSNERPPSGWFNWWMNLVYLWIAWLKGFINNSGDFVYPTNQTRTLHLTAAACAQPLAADSWKAPTATASEITSFVNGAVAKYDLQEILPSGAANLVIDVMVTPGATLTSRGGAGTGLRIGLVSHAPDWATPATVSPTVEDTDEQADSTAIQLLTLNLAGSVDKSTKSYALYVIAGSDAASNQDDIRAIRIRFTDPGPRNF